MNESNRQLARVVPVFACMWLLAAVGSRHAIGAPPDAPQTAPTEPERISVFDAKKLGYMNCRIPGIVVTQRGTVLAWCEARHGKGGDWDPIEILLRRSEDGGRQWGEPFHLAGDGKRTYNNPVGIVDRQNSAIHFLYCVEYARCYYTRSDDDGKTFSPPVDITPSFEEFKKDYGWNVIATGPCHGIQLRSGRLLVPVWLSTGGHTHHPSVVATIYSDDHGATWHRGDIAVQNTTDVPNPNETIAIELADGRVMLNVRNESPRHRRVVVVSPDGATDWSAPVFDDTLTEVICNASIVRLTTSPPSDRNRIVFVNPDNDQDPPVRKAGRSMLWRQRKNLTLRLSYDEGKTWPVSKILQSGPTDYSDLAVGPDGTIYCLYNGLNLARITLDWLTDGQDRLGPARAEAPASTVLFSTAAFADGKPVAGSALRSVRVPVTRDTWFSAVGREADGNLGGAGQLKLKSIQEMSIVDIDPGALKGHVIRRTTLHVRKRGNEVLHRVTISSFSSDWVEGTSSNYEPQAGSSCFNFKRYPDVPWAYAGSDLTAVTLGQGGSVWAMAEATPPDVDGWMQIAVDPAIVAARVAGISQGFLLFDDTGSEWTRNGEQFKINHFPNRYVFSKDNGTQNAPYFTIELGEEDRQPPGAPEQLQSSSRDLPAGEADVSWLTPKDTGPAGTVGFVVEVDGKPVPQYLAPAAAIAGSRVTMHLRDLGLKPGATAHVDVRAVDGAGNAGEPASIDVVASSEAVGVLPGEDPKPFTDGGALPRIGGAEVAIIDALDKVQPVTGKMIPPQEPAYLSANHLWNAGSKTVRLHAARNEFTSFQIVLRGAVKDLSARLELSGQPAFDVGFFRYANVASRAGPVPDPLVPFEGHLTTPSGDSNASLLCEIYVPHDAAKGKHSGTLLLTSGAEELKIAVELAVWDFTLPDYLSFIPEMNCYGLPADEADYYRLAHRNRTVINRVPYYQNGVIADGCAPAWNGKSLDWAAWDARFGPYLDGSAFSDMPRKGVPLEIFYLPIFENWPSPMEGNYNGSYWADEAFPPAYRQSFVECSRQFAAHFNAKKWDGTLFQCFFNGKTDFKERGWSHESSPWLLDEPANFQDYWALRWFGQAFHEGTAAEPGAAKMLFRCDISRPQWQRDALDGVLNYNVVAGGPFHQYHRLVMDRKRRFGQVVITYGSSNDPADSNMQPVGWCLDSWTLGADGVLPWQVIGSDASWKKGEDTCLFYPGGPAGQKGPVASIRLKAYLRGEQDVEYLALLARLQKQSQLELGRTVRAAMNLKGERKATGFVGGEAAGVIDISGLRPQDAWRLRERIGAVLSEAHPQPLRKL